MQLLSLKNLSITEVFQFFETIVKLKNVFGPVFEQNYLKKITSQNIIIVHLFLCGKIVHGESFYSRRKFWGLRPEGNAIFIIKI